MTQRQLEIENRWNELRDRIDSAAQKSGRDASDVTVIAVTKTFPPSDVDELLGLGFSDFGENRVAELRDKASHEYANPPTWHMLGQLQTNKVNHAVRAAKYVHSCDRARLVQALERAATNQRKELGVLIQVRLDDDPKRGGIALDQVGQLAAEIAGCESLTLKGLMAMAPREGDPARAFAALGEVSRTLIQDHPGATWISAGMSNDFEIAIEHGATHVRLGRGLLGTRPLVG